MKKSELKTLKAFIVLKKRQEKTQGTEEENALFTKALRSETVVLARYPLDGLMT